MKRMSRPPTAPTHTAAHLSRPLMSVVGFTQPTTGVSRSSATGVSLNVLTQPPAIKHMPSASPPPSRTMPTASPRPSATWPRQSDSSPDTRVSVVQSQVAPTQPAAANTRPSRHAAQVVNPAPSPRTVLATGAAPLLTSRAISPRYAPVVYVRSSSAHCGVEQPVSTRLPPYAAGTAVVESTNAVMACASETPSRQGTPQGSSQMDRRPLVTCRSRNSVGNASLGTFSHEPERISSDSYPREPARAARLVGNASLGTFSHETERISSDSYPREDARAARLVGNASLGTFSHETERTSSDSYPREYARLLSSQAPKILRQFSEPAVVVATLAGPISEAPGVKDFGSARDNASARKEKGSSSTEASHSRSSTEASTVASTRDATPRHEEREDHASHVEVPAPTGSYGPSFDKKRLTAPPSAAVWNRPTPHRSRIATALPNTLDVEDSSSELKQDEAAIDLTPQVKRSQSGISTSDTPSLNRQRSSFSDTPSLNRQQSSFSDTPTVNRQRSSISSKDEFKVDSFTALAATPSKETKERRQISHWSPEQSLEMAKRRQSITASPTPKRSPTKERTPQQSERSPRKSPRERSPRGRSPKSMSKLVQLLLDDTDDSSSVEIAHRAVAELLYESVPRENVQHLAIRATRSNAASRQNFVNKLRTERRSQVRIVWHLAGSSAAAEAIEAEGIRCDEDHCACGRYGRGGYVATSAAKANAYSDSEGAGGERQIFLALCLPEEDVVRGERGTRPKCTAADLPSHPTEYCFVDQDRLHCCYRADFVWVPTRRRPKVTTAGGHCRAWRSWAPVASPRAEK